ncbi:MAG: WD40 repeat domain-containing protein [Treponema sp.]|nr:WD40 repeat domain-containing protein [Treponema sp.]
MGYNTGILICGLSLLSILPAVSCLSAQVPQADKALLIPRGGHQGAVHTLIYDEQGRLLSAGDDGFLGIWDIPGAVAEERFQVSPYAIPAMVLRPGKSQVSLLERDGIDRYRIAAWDYEAKQKLFTIDSRYPISYITYSGGGNFLILVQQGNPEVQFIHAETGNILKAPDSTGTLSFAATGKSERTMIGYAPSGILSYWDLESGKEIRRFTVPDHIRMPFLFGNNRFIGGIDAGGLVILDAVSGTTIARERGISQGKVFALGGETPEFMCLATGPGASKLYHFAMSNTGRLEIKTQWPVPLQLPEVMSAVITADTLALGTMDGGVWIGKADGTVAMMEVRNQESIIDAAAVASSLAFLTEGQVLGFIPLDYTQLEDKTLIPLEPSIYTRLASDPEAGEGGMDGLLLWQETPTGSLPIIRTLGTDAVPVSQGKTLVLDQLSLRFPLRSAVLRGEQALFLDSVGNITVLSVSTGARLFSFSSVASLDATLLKDGNILIGQSVVSGSAPFLIVNSSTGETLPLPIPASVGARVYCGASGVPYGVTVDAQEGRLTTAITRLSLANPSHSSQVAVYPGEDTGFGIAESRETLAATLGGEEAIFYGSRSPRPFKRSPGFPLRLIDGGAYCIALDTEGTIAWYDPESGALLALFHLYENEWILEKPEAPPIRGGLNWKAQTEDGRR